MTETLHPAERAELSALPAAERPAAFARCWTRKEALLKATGSGLGHGTLPTVLVGTSATPHPVPGWTLTDLALSGGYAAACAVRAYIEDAEDAEGSEDSADSAD
ncbi:4'-phosphopantetheinyl transferase family protein [Streptomyces sp. NPDC002851]